MNGKPSARNSGGLNLIHWVRVFSYRSLASRNKPSNSFNETSPQNTAMVSPKHTALQVVPALRSSSCRSALRLCVASRRHGFHTSRTFQKNPYHFYDLVAKQPRSSFDPAQFSFNNGHLSATDRVKLVFGQLGSRQDRILEAQRQAFTIAGLKLSPRPQEPNNCCMSGCIDCVWELYKEELVEWKEKRAEIKRKLLFERQDLEWPVAVLGLEPKERQSVHKAADRAKLEEKIEADKDADDDLNVSIKAFLKTEKRLKEKRKLMEQQQHQQQQQANA